MGPQLNDFDDFDFSFNFNMLFSRHETAQNSKRSSSKRQFQAFFHSNFEFHMNSNAPKTISFEKEIPFDQTI